MANRLIRDGLLESEAVLSLTVEARWLFVAVMLSADDLGLFEATEFSLARRADLRRDVAGKLLQMLADADLVRLYEADGKRYGFIPRFRQRLQIKRSRYPMPPSALMQDDIDAVNKIKHLADKATDEQPLDNGGPVDGQPSEPEPEPLKYISVATQPRRQRKAADPTACCPHLKIVEAYHEILPELPRVKLLDSTSRKKHTGALWRWVLTSRKPDGTPRATNAEQALAWIRSYFDRARLNDFLMGRGERSAAHANWRCDYDFLLTEKGLRQVIEKTEVVS